MSRRFTEQNGEKIGVLGALLGGEPEADVVGDPLAFRVAEVGAQGFSDFGEVGGSFGGWQGCGEALGECIEPPADIAGKRSGAWDQGNVSHDKPAVGEFP
jgi:hypothetical protein